jgi:polyhydroxybutyrate depolymerase
MVRIPFLSSTGEAMPIAVYVIALCLGLWSATVRGADADARHTLRHQGQERHYLLRLPEGVRALPGARLPLVLVLHGGGGNAENAEATTGFTALAQREGFVVAYPEGTGTRAGRLLAWNARHCCGQAMQRGVDDVGFIRALIDHLVAELAVDPRRVYVTGLSNGGMMTHRLGIALADRLAAVAPVIATLFGDEPTPAQPLPALMINGRLDTQVPPAGGPPGGRFASAWDGTPTLPALAQADFWARANGCGPQPQPQPQLQGQVSRWRYACPAGQEVELLMVADNGHAWPGGQPGSRRGDTPGRALDASAVIWEFFRTHVRR